METERASEDRETRTTGRPLDAEAAGRIVRRAAGRYFAERRERVSPFVDRNFSFRGSAALHRKAVGWDLVRAPANLLLATPYALSKLGGQVFRTLGRERTARYLDSRKILLETAIAREIQWLIVTDLLELPFEQGERVSRHDALAEAILGEPEVQTLLADAALAVGPHAGEPAFREKLTQAMADYAGTRAAAAEITTALLTLGAGAVAIKQTTPGMITLGPALATALAQHLAVASFPLGATAGAVWYGIFPVAASPLLTVGMTGGLLAVGSVATAFAGIVADPVQRRLGIHQKRLERLVGSLEQQFTGTGPGRFVARDHYVARLLDLADVLMGAVRAASR